jgi:dCMP deaminase
MPNAAQRPDHDTYYMQIAMAVRERADCKGQKVGAVIVLKNRIISTGYNGTPTGMRNCSDGGCHRCAHRGTHYAPGTAYDLCICVHAEQNALLSAARFGISVDGATLYTTTQPCFGCLKEMLQAGIDTVYFRIPWTANRNAEQEEQYKMLQNKFHGRVHHLNIPDPHESSGGTLAGVAATVSDEHGMQTP